MQMSQCTACGYTWETGKDGSHRCHEHIAATALRAEFESWKESLTVSSTPGFLRGLQAALSGMARRINAISLHLEIREYFDGLIAGEKPVAPIVPADPPYFGANRKSLYAKSRR